MIWRLLIYGVTFTLTIVAPPWWSGFATGVGALVLVADVFQWSATRRHHKDTEHRVKGG